MAKYSTSTDKWFALFANQKERRAVMLVSLLIYLLIETANRSGRTFYFRKELFYRAFPEFAKSVGIKGTLFRFDGKECPALTLFRRFAGETLESNSDPVTSMICSPISPEEYFKKGYGDAPAHIRALTKELRLKVSTRDLLRFTEEFLEKSFATTQLPIQYRKRNFLQRLFQRPAFSSN